MFLPPTPDETSRRKPRSIRRLQTGKKIKYVTLVLQIVFFRSLFDLLYGGLFGLVGFLVGVGAIVGGGPVNQLQKQDLVLHALKEFW